MSYFSPLLTHVLRFSSVILEIFPVSLHLCRLSHIGITLSLVFYLPFFLLLAFKYETNLWRWTDESRACSIGLMCMRDGRTKHKVHGLRLRALTHV